MPISYLPPATLEITDTRTFQHLALLVDRPDFKADLIKYRPAILAKQFVTSSSTLDPYLPNQPNIPDEIFDLLDKYRYPDSLAIAIQSLIINNKITDNEVQDYQPIVGKPKSKLRHYLPHPFDLRLDSQIKRNRSWYLLYQENENKNQNDYLGFHKIAKIVNAPYTTIYTAITAYQNKLLLKLI